MARLRFTQAAVLDLESIGDYWAAENPTRAIKLISELRSACGQISAAPRTHSKSAEI